MARIPLAGRRIWLTGASSGIGQACAREFARRGARVAISARNVEALDALASELPPGAILVVPLDVRDRLANHAAVAKIVEAWGGLDTVVLNAGISELVDIENFDATIFDRVFATNFHAVTYGMEACLPELRRGIHPHLVGICSCSAWFPLPLAEAYASAKAAMRYLLNTFRIRCESTGLWVTGIYPGFVSTPMVNEATYPKPLCIPADRAACAIADGMERRRREIHFPKLFTWPVKLAGHLPTWLYQAISSRLVRFYPAFDAGSHSQPARAA